MLPDYNQAMDNSTAPPGVRLPQSLAARINLGLGILAILLIIILLQNSLSEAIKVGRLVPSEWRTIVGMAATNQVWVVIKLVVLVPVVTLWLLDRKRALRKALLFGLGLMTFELLASVLFLALTLAEDTTRTAGGLIRDTLVVALINVLTFSLWYWLMDDAPLLGSRKSAPNDFLFPQYANALTLFEGWRPRYLDYLFLAFTTTTAFGPTDTLPLTRRAKMLMMTQALVSVVIIVVLASRALSILR